MEFPADITHLTRIMDFVRSAIEKKNLSLQEQMRIELAAEEAVVNVISYAYPEKQGNEKIDVCLPDAPPHEMIIEITDWGTPFNPTEAPIDPKVDRPLHERKVGGLGIYLIRKLADSMSYKRDGKKNILSVTFRVVK